MDHEKQAITRTVALYFTGAYHGDATQLQQAFHPAAHIVGSFNGQINDWTLTEFIARVTTKPTAAEKNEKYDKEIIMIDTIGDTAIVKARVVAGGYTFFDYISLLKINGSWIIRHKGFTTL